jgi:hypothetical protein
MKVAEFQRLVVAVRDAGYGDDLDWAEKAKAPESADEFAREAIFVICNSGMRFTVAQGIFDRVKEALANGEHPGTVFGHKGKCAGIGWIWQNRHRLLTEYLAADDKLAFCESLPWIGQITKYHLAKNFGADVAKPDVHLQRLADHAGTTPQALCERLGAATGLRVATVDVVLWRACAIGLIQSRHLGA